MSISVERVGDRHAADPIPFGRHPNGLVDIACYEPYLVDPFSNVPIQPADPGGHRGEWVAQHIYFSEATYRQVDLPEPQRDPRLRFLRTSPYSQIYMRTLKEMRLHRDMENDVSPPPIETVEAALKDYDDIDLVAAASLGVQDALVRRPSLPSHEGYNSRTRDLSAHTKAKIFQAELEKAAESLERPRALPRRVVASALMRLAVGLNDHTLNRIVQEHLSPGEALYPLKIPSIAYLRNLGRTMLVRSLSD